MNLVSVGYIAQYMDEHAFPPTRFAVALRYIWWQRWDDDNCQNGVALPM